MDAEVILSKHPVFTREDWLKNLAGSDSVRTKETKLHYYVKKGRAVRMRQGLYISVPPGDDPLAVQPDPFLVCAKSAADSVIAYHAAMEFHGRAYSLHQRFDFLTIADIRSFEFRGVSYRALTFPARLIEAEETHCEVEKRERSGVTVRVTTLERTLVDALDRPELAGGWEEIWRSMGSVEYYDGKRIVNYLKLLDNATTVAKTGFFLEQHLASLPFGAGVLEELAAMRPQQPRRMGGQRRGDDIFMPRWNLVVPLRVAERRWEEPA